MNAQPLCPRFWVNLISPSKDLDIPLRSIFCQIVYLFFVLFFFLFLREIFCNQIMRFSWYSKPTQVLFPLILILSCVFSSCRRLEMKYWNKGQSCSMMGSSQPKLSQALERTRTKMLLWKAWLAPFQSLRDNWKLSHHKS